MKFLKNPYVQTFIGVVVSIAVLRLVLSVVPVPDSIKKWIAV